MMYRYIILFVGILCYNDNSLFKNTNVLLKTVQIFVYATLHDGTDTLMPCVICKRNAFNIRVSVWKREKMRCDNMIMRH